MLKVKKGAMGKLLGVAPAQTQNSIAVKDMPGRKYEDGTVGRMSTLGAVKKNTGIQPRLNERTITKGIQETDRYTRQGGEDRDSQPTAYKQLQGKESIGGRLQGGLSGAGNNTAKPVTMKPASKVTEAPFTNGKQVLLSRKQIPMKKFKTFKPLSKI